MKHWSNKNRKLAARRNERIFLHECKRRNLVPNHISNGIKSINGLFEFGNVQVNRKLKYFNDRLTQKIINPEIRHIVTIIHKIENENMHILKILERTLPSLMLKEFEQNNINPIINISVK